MNIEKLHGNIPDSVFNQLPDTINKFQINTSLRLAHFLSQCAHESGGFTITKENLNYSVDGLKKIFPKYFPNNLAESYARQPEKIGNRVYANRIGNGDENSGDGFKYRGRGYIQITGKENYINFNKLVEEDVVENPDLVATKYPLLSAAWFFSERCLPKADYGPSDATIASVTKCVNGGFIGLEERTKYFKKFYALLNS